MNFLNKIDQNILDQFIHSNADLSLKALQDKLRFLQQILSISGTQLKCPCRNVASSTLQLPEQVALPASLCARVVQETGFFFEAPPIDVYKSTGFCTGASVVFARSMLAGWPIERLGDVLPNFRVSDEGVGIQAEFEVLVQSQIHKKFISLMLSWVLYLKAELYNPSQSEEILAQMIEAHPNAGIQEFLLARARNELPLDSLALRTFIEASEQAFHFGFGSIVDAMKQLKLLVNGSVPPTLPLHPFVQSIAQAFQACPPEVDWHQGLVEQLYSPTSPLFLRYLTLTMISNIDKFYIDQTALKGVAAEHGLMVGENIAATREQFTSALLMPGMYLLGHPVNQGTKAHMSTLCLGETEGVFYDSNIGVFTFPATVYPELLSAILQIYNAGEPGEEQKEVWAIFPCSLP